MSLFFHSAGSVSFPMFAESYATQIFYCKAGMLFAFTCLKKAKSGISAS
jgi:hypothetical protein